VAEHRDQAGTQLKTAVSYLRVSTKEQAAKGGQAQRCLITVQNKVSA
jgi:hypothetical protein